MRHAAFKTALGLLSSVMMACCLYRHTCGMTHIHCLMQTVCMVLGTRKPYIIMHGMHDAALCSVHCASPLFWWTFVCCGHNIHSAPTVRVVRSRADIYFLHFVCRCASSTHPIVRFQSAVSLSRGHIPHTQHCMVCLPCSPFFKRHCAPATNSMWDNCMFIASRRWKGCPRSMYHT